MVFKPARIPFFLPVALLGLSLLIAACAPTPPRSDPQLDQAIRQAEASKEAQRLANALWAKAAVSEDAEALDLQLRAIEVLIDSGKPEDARAAVNLLRDPRARVMQWGTLYPRRAMLVQAFDLMQRQQLDEAIQKLNNIPAPLQPQEAVRRLELLAQAHAQSKQPVLAIQQRIALDGMLHDERRMQNQEALLQLLRGMDTSALEKARQASSDATLSAWLDLGLAERKNIKALEQWRMAHPSLPLLPALFENIKREMAARKPVNTAHIALLLPNDASFEAAARAVLAGTQQAQTEAGETAPEVREYTYSSQLKDMRSALDNALQAGAIAIIGPLDRPSLQALVENKPALPRNVPLIALNTLEGSNGISGVLQFGLPPEDEAAAIASRMANQGQKRVLILAPGDALGERMSKAFRERMQAEGGSIVASEIYSPSGGRANDWNIRIQQLLRPQPNPMTGKPGMREDADALFFIARAADGRQAVPYIRAQGGGDLAIVASSHIYEGAPRPEQDRSLDGVVFSDMPLILAYVRRPGQSENRFELAVRSSQPRLFALGFDAYGLARQLAAGKKISEMPGQTGQLKLGEDGRVQRTPSFGVFRGGLANPLGIPADAPQP